MALSKQTQSLRFALREQTRCSHEKLDAFVQGLGIFHCPTSYQVYLASMHHAYRQLKDAMEWVEQKAGLLPLVDQLISSLESDLDSKTTASVEVDCGFGETKEERWGTAYIMEGSSMGARMILNALNKSANQLPTSYLSLLVESSKDRWPLFVSALDKSGCNVEQTVSAANLAFQTVYSTFAANAKLAGIQSTIESR